MRVRAIAAARASTSRVRSHNGKPDVEEDTAGDEYEDGTMS
jgi:hypothetical protein